MFGIQFWKSGRNERRLFSFLKGLTNIHDEECSQRDADEEDGLSDGGCDHVGRQQMDAGGRIDLGGLKGVVVKPGSGQDDSDHLP